VYGPTSAPSSKNPKGNKGITFPSMPGASAAGGVNPNWWATLSPAQKKYYQGIWSWSAAYVPGGGYSKENLNLPGGPGGGFTPPEGAGFTPGGLYYSGQQGLFPEIPNYNWWDQLGKNYGLKWTYTNPYASPIQNPGRTTQPGGWNTSDRYNAYGQPMYTQAPYGQSGGIRGIQGRGEGFGQHTPQEMGVQWFDDTIAAVKKALESYTPVTGNKTGAELKYQARDRKVGYLNKLTRMREKIWGTTGQGGTTPGAAYNSNWLNDLITWRSRE